MDRSSWDSVFTSRFSHHEAELKWLYCELYHGDFQAYEYFVSMLNRMYMSRPEALKQIDAQRSQNPEWYKGHSLTGMLMYVRSFAETLQGVREHLPYLKDCGIRYLHLMPLLESPAGRSDGGYAVSDFTRIQPELGTMADFEALTQACHDEGIAVCLDFVMNHTSESHAWAVAARNGDRFCQDRYFFYDSWDIPNEFEKTVPQVFPQTAPGNFTWCSQAQKVVMTTFYPYQWDLNYANPVVMNDMTELMLGLCNHGVDIIRLDAVPYIWKQLYTSCRNLPQVHTLVRILRMVCEIVCPGTLLLGEVVMEPSKVVPYFGTVEKPECHLLYNVTTMATIWHTVATQDVSLMVHQLEQVFALPREYCFLNYLRCHDDIGWGLDYQFLSRFGIEERAHKHFLNQCLTGKLEGSLARGELYNDDPRLGDARLCGTTASLCGITGSREKHDPEALAQAECLDLMLHAFMFTLSGIPVLYSGDEIGMENDLSYHNDPYKADDSRYLHRGKMDWNKAELRQDLSTTEGRLFTGIRHMETIREQCAVFDAHAYITLLDTHSPHVLGIRRETRDERLLALFNFSTEAQSVVLPGEVEYLDLIDGVLRKASRIHLPAHAFVWLWRNRQNKGLTPVSEPSETACAE